MLKAFVLLFVELPAILKYFSHPKSIPFVAVVPTPKFPLHFILPFTSNNYVGEVVLIPNLPLLVNLMTFLEFHTLLPHVQNDI
jgi:hypothetical protein